MGNIRVNQSVVEFIVLQNPNVRVNQSVVEFMTLPLPPTLSCGSPPPGSQDVPYSHTFPETGGLAPFVYSITSGALPPGLTLNASTGNVSGTPTSGGLYQFTITVFDANLQSSSVPCSILIAGVVRITLRGVKRVRCDEEGNSAPIEDAPQLPSVKRAM